MAKKATPKKRAQSTPKAKSSAPSKFNYDLIAFVLLGLVLLILAYIKSGFLDIPFERDEGDYMFGARLWLEGKTSYLDFYEQKPPGIFYCYAFIMSIFGSTAVDLQLGFIFVVITSVIFLHLAVRNFFGSIAAIWTSSSYAFLSMTLIISGFTTQSEHFMAMLISLALFLLSIGLNKEKSSVYYLLAGLAIGCSGLIKQNAVFFALSLGLIMTFYLYSKKKEWKPILINGGIYVVGILIPFILTIISLKSKGALDEAIFWIFNYPREAYINVMTADLAMDQLERIIRGAMKTHLLFWLLGLIGLALSVRYKRNRTASLINASFLILAAIATVPGLHFYGHYFLFFIPALAVSIGFVIHWLLKNFPEQSKVISNGSLVALVLLLGFHMNANKSYYFKPNHKKIIVEAYGVNPFVSTKILAENIKKRANEGDKLIVLGSEPQMHIYSGLNSPSRHTFLSMLVSGHERNMEWQEEFFNEVESDTPRFVVNVMHGISWLAQKGSPDSIFKWSSKLINENYKPIALADLTRPVVYKWDEDTYQYKLRSTNYIYVYERMTPEEVIYRKQSLEAMKNGTLQTP